MTQTSALFIEIHGPEAEEPLRFVCGGDFDVLRTDATGMDIYGKSLHGCEYLLFPMDFRPVNAGLLQVQIPASFEDHPLSAQLNGARIHFKAAHGSPFFVEMPEEYWTDTGTLRINAEGHIIVELDKAEDGAAPGHNHDHDHGQSCGCGHHHGPHHHQPAGGHARHGQACGCGCEEAAPPTAPDGPAEAMNRRELAAAIRARCNDLNALLALAAKAGIQAELVLDQTPDGPRPRIVRIVQEL